MDLSDITKLASRKRINADAENLREKVSQEAAKIVKLRVRQDTSYWELKEKLGDVEREHARLQQNMVDMQMQHETLSTQYQEELRLRPETLNKLASTREICDVLEEYMTRIRGTLQRCVADKVALSDAYSRASAAVSGTRDDIERRVASAAMQARAHCSQLLSRAEYSAQLAVSAEAARAHGEAAVAAARAHVADLSAEAGRLRDQRDKLADTLATREHQLGESEKAIAELNEEMKRLTVEYSTQSERLKNALADLERESNAAMTLRDALQSAELRGESAASEAARLRTDLAAAAARGESYSRETATLQQALAAAESRADNADTELVALRNKLAATTAERDTARDRVNELELKCQSVEALCEEMKQKSKDLLEHSEWLVKELDAKIKTIESLEMKVKNLESENTSLEAEKSRVTGELRDVTAERDAARLDAERAAADAAACAADRDNTRQQLEELRAASTRASEAGERERAERADTIARLMRDVAQEAEARARCDAALQAARADCAAAQADAHTHATRLTQALGSKEKEVADQMKIILEIRSEKERLQEKIRGMQSTIDNIQKELVPKPTEASPGANRDPPEHDDNAMCAPPKPMQKDVFAKPKKTFVEPEARTIDSMLYNFLSDSSMESDALDPAEVTRRFEALSRGAAPSPTPLRPAKRRHNTQQFVSGSTRSDVAPVSLSQVREALNARGRTFFKNKRGPEAKPKKQK